MFWLTFFMVAVVTGLEEDAISWKNKVADISQRLEAIQGKADDFVRLHHSVFKLKSWFLEISTQLDQMELLLEGQQQNLAKLADQLSHLRHDEARRDKSKVPRTNARDWFHDKCVQCNCSCIIDEMIRTETRKELERAVQNSPIRYLEEEMRRMKTLMRNLEQGAGSTVAALNPSIYRTFKAYGKNVFQSFSDAD